MVSIRMANVQDLLQVQNTNLWCLPENYQVCVYVCVCYVFNFACKF